MNDCPFFAGSTITDPRFFVGRREALKLLSDRMQGSQPTSINVVGRQKTGKSSLLKHFQQTYGQRVSHPERYRVIYLSLQHSACETENSFYQKIGKELGTQIAEMNRNGFTEWVQGLKGSGVLPVLCVDNFEELLQRKEQFPNGFYDNLRFLIDSNCLMMVMASREMLDVYSREKQITSDFFNVFQTIDLNSGLIEDEAQELVQKKDSAGKGLTEDLQTVALKWGENDPYLLQCAGENLWKVQFNQKSWEDAKKDFEWQVNRFQKSWKSKLRYQAQTIIFIIPQKIKTCLLWSIENPDKLLKLMLAIAVVVCLVLAIFGKLDFEKAGELLKLIQGK